MLQIQNKCISQSFCIQPTITLGGPSNKSTVTNDGSVLRNVNNLIHFVWLFYFNFSTD